MMKKLFKVGLVLGAAFFIFMAGLGIGFAGGMFAGYGSSGRLDLVRADRIVNERIFIEEDVERLVEEAFVEAVEDPLRGEFAFELEGVSVIVERHGRFGPDITVIPPIPPIPEVPVSRRLPSSCITADLASLVSLPASCVRSSPSLSFSLASGSSCAAAGSL